MPLEPVATPDDRSVAVESGRIVKTGYVPVEQVTILNRSRMAIGDVDLAYRKRLSLGNRQPWPCPVGYWHSERFILVDGRHEYVAALMLGCTHILVAWTEKI
jgi:hypothetical protein